MENNNFNQTDVVSIFLDRLLECLDSVELNESNDQFLSIRSLIIPFTTDISKYQLQILITRDEDDFLIEGDYDE